jgi:hypothetical protein
MAHHDNGSHAFLAGGGWLNNAPFACRGPVAAV